MKAGSTLKYSQFRLASSTIQVNSNNIFYELKRRSKNESGKLFKL